MSGINFNDTTEKPVTSSTFAPNRTEVANVNYTALLSDTLVVYSSLTATKTVTLPAVATVPVGKMYFIKDESGSAGLLVRIIIDGNGAETIDGSANIQISAAYGKATIYSTGTAWFTL